MLWQWNGIGRFMDSQSSVFPLFTYLYNFAGEITSFCSHFKDYTIHYHLLLFHMVLLVSLSITLIVKTVKPSACCQLQLSFNILQRHFPILSNQRIMLSFLCRPSLVNLLTAIIQTVPNYSWNHQRYYSFMAMDSCAKHESLIFSLPLGKTCADAWAKFVPINIWPQCAFFH